MNKVLESADVYSHQAAKSANQGIEEDDLCECDHPFSSHNGIGSAAICTECGVHYEPHGNFFILVGQGHLFKKK